MSLSGLGAPSEGPHSVAKTAAPLFIAVVTFAIYFPSLGNDFVNWDDYVLITQNPILKSLSLHNIGMFLQNTFHFKR